MKKKNNPYFITLKVEFNGEVYEQLEKKQKIILQTLIEGDIVKFSKELARKVSLYTFHLSNFNE